MQLSTETINFLTNVIQVAKILKIENIILDKECVRGHFQEEGSMIIHRTNLPNFEFNSLGISRISVLDTRLSLLGNSANIEAEEKQMDSGEKTIYKLILSNNKTTVEFKCVNPALIPKAPKLLKDPVFFTFDVSEESIVLLVRAQSAIKGDNVSFSGSKTGVVAKLSDTEGDMFNHIISDKVVYSSESDKDKFYFSYKLRTLVPLLKAALTEDGVTINITRRGIINLMVNGINVYITQEI